MYNITIVFSMHIQIGNCNSKELYTIIEEVKPDVIFEEFDIDRTEDEYYKNGRYKYQNGSTLETFAVMNYLEKNKVVYVPVDTYDITYVPTDMYKKISTAGEKYDELFNRNILLSSEKGFQYINSIACCNLLEDIHSIEVDVVSKINDKKLLEDYRAWQLVTENRDNEMLKNVYTYCKNNTFNNAIFIIGAEHRKSILEKINDYNSKETIKINWKLWRIT